MLKFNLYFEASNIFTFYVLILHIFSSSLYWVEKMRQTSASYLFHVSEISYALDMKLYTTFVSVRKETNSIHATAVISWFDINFMCEFRLSLSDQDIEESMTSICHWALVRSCKGQHGITLKYSSQFMKLSFIPTFEENVIIIPTMHQSL